MGRKGYQKLRLERDAEECLYRWGVCGELWVEEGGEGGPDPLLDLPGDGGAENLGGGVLMEERGSVGVRLLCLPLRDE